MKKLSNEMKRNISKLHHEQNLSNGAIAKLLKISKSTVKRYKNYNHESTVGSEKFFEGPKTKNNTNNHNTISCVVDDNTFELFNHLIHKTQKTKKEVIESCILTYYMLSVSNDYNESKVQEIIIKESKKLVKEDLNVHPFFRYGNNWQNHQIR